MMAIFADTQCLFRLATGIDAHRCTSMTTDHCISQGYWFESSRRSFYQRLYVRQLRL